MPGNIAAYHVSQILTIEVEVDLSSGAVINADCTLAPDISRRCVIDLLVGHRMDSGMEPVIDNLQERCHTGAERSIVTALRNLHLGYCRTLSGSEDGTAQSAAASKDGSAE